MAARAVISCFSFHSAMSHAGDFHETNPGYAVIFIPESNVASSKWPHEVATYENNSVRQILFNRHILLTLDKSNKERK
jgi:hypothetical protein